MANLHHSSRTSAARHTDPLDVIRDKIAEGRADVAAGRTVTATEVLADLDASLDRMAAPRAAKASEPR